MSRRESFKAMDSKVIILPKRDLSPLLSRNHCGSLLFVDDPFSVCFQELFLFPSHVSLCWIFAFLHMPFLVLFRVPLEIFCLF